MTLTFNQDQTVVQNPVIPGFNPDPSVCRVGDDYFLATSTFEYFPGVPIYHSSDLVNWTLIGHALNRPSQLNLRTVDAGGGIWAPTLRYNKGRWYMATCCVWKWGRKPQQRIKPRGFFVYTDNIWDESSWSDPVPIDLIGIDQDLFFDDNGRAYLCAVMWKTVSPIKDHFETYGVEIDIKTGRNLHKPVLLRRSPLINFCAEGPHIFKRNNMYYLLTAEGGTELHHRAMIYVSESPLGPYREPPGGINPLVHNHPDHPTVRQTGHLDLVQAKNGEWWGFLLATRRQSSDTSQLGRETFLVPVEWPEGGWPIVNKGYPVSLTVRHHALPSVTRSSMWIDNFDQETLGPGWYHLRTPLRMDYTLSEIPGKLSLYGNAYRIDTQECPAMLLRKQTAYSGLWSTRLTFKPSTICEEAGITAYWSIYSYIAIVMRRSVNGTMELAVRWIDEETDELQEMPFVIDGQSVDLAIRARPTTYICLYRVDENQPWQSITELSSKVLQRNRAFDSPYTGTHFGLFAQGTNWEQCMTPAVFDYASFIEE